MNLLFHQVKGLGKAVCPKMRENEKEEIRDEKLFYGRNTGSREKYICTVSGEKTV